jgi:hypothetical protein
VTGLDLGEMQERDPQINDPYATTAMLSGLLSDKKYRIYIWARTAKGRGEAYFIELVTTKAGGKRLCCGYSLQDAYMLINMCTCFFFFLYMPKLNSEYYWQGSDRRHCACWFLYVSTIL